MQIRATRLLNTTIRIGCMLMVAVYALFSVGVLKATHFCMGREASVTFFTAEAEKCCCALFAAEADNCCDNEREVIALKNDQKILTSIIAPLPELYFLRVVILPAVQEQELLARSSFQDRRVESPPKIPLYQSNCSLIYYDDEIA